MSELEELNSTITAEVDKILHEYGLFNILKKYGNTVPTGSYVLGLMTWRDLDIYLENGEMTVSEFFRLGEEIALNLNPARMYYRNENIGKTPGNPDGLYWGIYTVLPDFPEEWKIDVWAIDAAQASEFQKQVDKLKSRITERDREAILLIKNHFCRHPAYRKDFNSMDIYKAVLDEGITSTYDFSKWLKDVLRNR